MLSGNGMKKEGQKDKEKKNVFLGKILAGININYPYPDPFYSLKRLSKIGSKAWN